MIKQSSLQANNKGNEIQTEKLKQLNEIAYLFSRFY